MTHDSLPLADTQPTTPTFQFTLTGSIEKADGKAYLVCPDSTRMSVSQLPSNCPTEPARWQVIPSTDSTGVISNVSVVDFQPESTDNSGEDRCDLVGRVVQLGKRNSLIQFKVERPGEKTLKLTLRSADTRMKIGQLWQVSALRVGCTLCISYAEALDAIAPASTNSEETSNPTPALPDTPTTPKEAIVLPNPTPPTELASVAIAQETGTTGWELTEAHKRSFGWEWEAFNPGLGRRARIQVYGRGQKTCIYHYPHLEQGEQEELRSQLRAGGRCRAGVPRHEAQRREPPHASGSPVEATDRRVSPVEPPGVELRENVHKDSLFVPSSPASPVPCAPPSPPLVVTPLGAAQGIGASCFQVEIGPYEVVLDCGTRPKGYDPLPALDYLNNPDLLLISHAHQDHLGAVPVFHNRYPSVRMICTTGTREIAHVMLQDCLKVQQLNEDSPALFDEVDLERTLFRLETEPIGKDFEPLPGLTVRFINAGHIVGAACIYLRYGDRSLVYTGDYNTASSRTTEGLKLGDLPEADMLITESTYGADTHPARKTQETALMSAIAEVVQSGGNVLIPAFALGRAQEILLTIRTSNLFQKLSIPIYVDGLVRAVTDTFRENLSQLPLSVQNLVKQNGMEPFFNEKSNPTIIPISNVRERPLAMATPSVIVASSGMLTGGASVYYAKTLLERENAAIFISGYTDEESPGRLLQNLQNGDTIELDGKELTVRAQIKRFNLSAHADKVGLTQVISKVNPKHLILIHGSRNALHELARSGDLRSKHYIHIPSVGEKIEYGVTPEHLNSSQVARIQSPQEFEVEVSAEMEGAWIRIPESVVESDPRWRLLAGNGVLKAKWDGFHLRLSPVSQQHLAIEEARASGLDCCAVCQFFSSGNCQCLDSPLYERFVDPSGICQEFTREDDV